MGVGWVVNSEHLLAASCCISRRSLVSSQAVCRGLDRGQKDFDEARLGISISFQPLRCAQPILKAIFVFDASMILVEPGGLQHF